jgi:hypothetical protein
MTTLERRRRGFQAHGQRVDSRLTRAGTLVAMYRLTLLALVGVALLADCGGGGGGGEPAAATTTAPPTTTVDKCKGSTSAAVRARKIRRLSRDVARLRVLAAPIQKKTLDGTPALSAAVDRFLLDVADRDVPIHVRSRFIDRAAALVAPVCEQCFQALEASRPIAGGAKMGCG